MTNKSSLLFGGNMAGRSEIQKSIEVFENPSKHIFVEKDGSILYSSEMVRAFEIAIEELQDYDERLESYGWL